MTDPVVPPSSGGQFPPPNAGPQGFPPPNAGGQFPPPNAGAPGFPPPNQGAPGFPPPNQGAPGFAPPAPFPGTPEGKPKGRFAKKALSIVGTLVVIAIIAAIKFGIGTVLSEDPTKDAKAGDCLGVSQEVKETTTEVTAKIVECSSSDAKYTVLGRVEGIKDENSTACDEIINNGLKEGEEGAVIASQEDKGYLLCLKVN
ncbi:LppU/SCO3897 family protein [Actinoplanes sp. CA-252034]|uniref:LppU/SCO3897 family protein n=1 Tax=Actinoplanes sp. CA-252034 TaxID=3239906 RepID=UPI003D98ABF1